MESCVNRLRKANKKIFFIQGRYGLLLALMLTVSGKFTASVTPAWADEAREETKAHKLEPVVVSADKMESDVYDMPTNVDRSDPRRP